jgi:hypothetical protein
MKNLKIKYSRVTIIFVISIIIWFAIINIIFEIDANRTIYAESKNIRCNNHYINFVSHDYLYYEKRGKYIDSEKRNPPRSDDNIKKLKLVSLANHVSFYSANSTVNRRSRASYVIRGQIYKIVLKFRSDAFVDKYFALMPAIIFVNKEVFEKNCTTVVEATSLPLPGID